MNSGEVTVAKIRELAQQVTLVENSSHGSTELLASMPTPSAHIVGLTGPPGVGKSTSTSALIAQLRNERKSVAILAVDPSSTFSKGALLGDRIRMQEHALDSGVFIRSLAARGHLGGLTGSIYSVLKVISAAGFDVIIIETVGLVNPKLKSQKWRTHQLWWRHPVPATGFRRPKQVFWRSPIFSP